MKPRYDIVEVLSHDLNLKKHKDFFICDCPGCHGIKSVHVDPEAQFARCICGWGGDLYDIAKWYAEKEEK